MYELGQYVNIHTPILNMSYSTHQDVTKQYVYYTRKYAILFPVP